MACDLCASQHLELWLRKHDLDYLRCHDCGFVFADSAAFDAQRYNSENNATLKHHYARKQYSQPRQRRYRRQLKQFRQSGNRLLELGSSTGGFLFAAETMGWQAVGVEPVEDVANFGIEAHGLDIRICTIEDFADAAPAAETGYDVIYCNAVLEHLASPRSSLVAAHSLLRPGGLFFADTVNIDSYTCRSLGDDWRLLDPRAHLSLFTPRILEKLLLQTGFTDIDMRSHGVRFSSVRESSTWNPRRLARELKKAPYSLAARLFLKGDSIAVAAYKPVSDTAHPGTTSATSGS